jgi:hypothetical protein
MVEEGEEGGGVKRKTPPGDEQAQGVWVGLGVANLWGGAEPPAVVVRVVGICFPWAPCFPASCSSLSKKKNSVSLSPPNGQSSKFITNFCV